MENEQNNAGIPEEIGETPSPAEELPQAPDAGQNVDHDDAPMSHGSLKTKAMSGLFWMFGERILAQLISFIVSVVLARILMPEEYGTVSIVLVFINIANVFVVSGMGQSLIQKKNVAEIDYNTIFLTSHVMAWGLYLVLFFTAPLIANFYNNPELVWVLRVISLKLPISSLNTVQHAWVTRRMQFRKYFFSTLTGTLVSGAAGVVMALLGFGVWALVAQYLINSFMDATILFFNVRWKPKLQFSKDSFKHLFGYGFKLMLAQLINTTYVEMQALVIGKVYTKSDLAYYNRGNQFPSLIIKNINSSVGSVMFPTYSKVADDPAKLKSMVRRSMTLTSYLITPMMFGLIAVARPLVLVLLTEKWLPCVFFLQLACLRYLLQPIQTANTQAIKAMGKGTVDLIMEIVKKIFGVTALLIALHRGVNAIAIAALISVVFSALVSMFPNIFLMKYSIWEQIKDLLPGVLMSLAMLAAVYPMSFIPLPDVVILILQVLVGAGIYIGLSILFKVESFRYLLDFVKSLGARYGKRKKQ